MEGGRAATATMDSSLADHAIELSQTSVAAAAVNFAISNRDAAAHDVVLLATDLPPTHCRRQGPESTSRAGSCACSAQPRVGRPGNGQPDVAPPFPGGTSWSAPSRTKCVREAMVATLTVT